MKRALVVLVPCLLAACSGPPTRSAPAATDEARIDSPALPARVFVDRMLGALERQDADDWNDLLSARMRLALANDPAALHDHLAAWRRDVLPMARELRSSDLTVEPSGAKQVLAYGGDGRAPTALAHVVLEAGALHLDEH